MISVAFKESFNITISAATLLDNGLAIYTIANQVLDAPSYYNAVQCTQTISSADNPTTTNVIFTQYINAQTLYNNLNFFNISPEVPNWLVNNAPINVGADFIISLDENTFKFPSTITTGASESTNGIWTITEQVAYQIVGYIVDYSTCNNLKILTSDASLDLELYDPANGYYTTNNLTNVNIISDNDPAIYNNDLNSPLGYTPTENGIYPSWKSIQLDTYWLNSSCSYANYKLSNYNSNTSLQNANWSEVNTYSTLPIVYQWTTSSTLPASLPATLFSKSRSIQYACNSWQYRSSSKGIFSYISSGNVDIWISDIVDIGQLVQIVVSSGLMSDLNLSSSSKISTISFSRDSVTNNVIFDSTTVASAIQLVSLDSTILIGSSSSFAPIYATSAYISNIAVVSTSQFNNNLGNLSFNFASINPADSNSLWQVTCSVQNTNITETQSININSSMIAGSQFSVIFDIIGFSFVGILNFTGNQNWNVPSTNGSTANVNFINISMNEVPLTTLYQSTPSTYTLTYSITPALNVQLVSQPKSAILTYSINLVLGAVSGNINFQNPVRYVINNDISSNYLLVITNISQGTYYQGNFVVQETAPNVFSLLDVNNNITLQTNLQLATAYTITALGLTITINTNPNASQNAQIYALTDLVQIPFSINRQVTMTYNGSTYVAPLNQLFNNDALNGTIYDNANWTQNDPLILNLYNNNMFNISMTAPQITIPIFLSPGTYGLTYTTDENSQFMIATSANATIILTATIPSIAQMSQLLASAFGSSSNDISIKSSSTGYLLQTFSDNILYNTNDGVNNCWIGYNIPTIAQITGDNIVPNNNWQFVTSNNISDIDNYSNITSYIQTDQQLANNQQNFIINWTNWIINNDYETDCKFYTSVPASVDIILAFCIANLSIPPNYNYVLSDSKYIALYINGVAANFTLDNVNNCIVPTYKFEQYTVYYIHLQILTYSPSSAQLSNAPTDLTISTLWTYSYNFSFELDNMGNPNFYYWQEVAPITIPSSYAYIPTTVRDFTLSYIANNENVNVNYLLDANESLSLYSAVEGNNQVDVYNTFYASKIIITNSLLLTSSAAATLQFNEVSSFNEFIDSNFYKEWTIFDRYDNINKIAYNIFTYVIDSALGYNTKVSPPVAIPNPIYVNNDLIYATSSAYGFADDKILLDSYVVKQTIITNLTLQTSAIIYNGINIATAQNMTNILYSTSTPDEIVASQQALQFFYDNCLNIVANTIFFNVYDTMMQNEYSTTNAVMKSSYINIYNNAN